MLPLASAAALAVPIHGQDTTTGPCEGLALAEPATPSSSEFPSSSDEAMLRIARSLLETVPGGAAELRTYFETDPSYAYLLAVPALRDSTDRVLSTLSDGYGDTIRRGCEAKAIAHLREVTLDGYASLPWYRSTFSGELPELVRAPSAPDRFELDLDFSAARTLLEILSDPTLSRARIEEKVQSPVFSALLNHRNQDFYPVPLTRDVLVTSLERAASDDPLDRLYRFAFPVGLLHFAEVREHQAAYERLVSWLEENEALLSDRVAAEIVPFMPAHLRFSRTVHFLFADGADGWVSDGIAAVDLEFFKDDLERLSNVLLHETFHAVQQAARMEVEPRPADPRDRDFAAVLETIYQEGTANFLAPAQEKSETERLALAKEGLAMLEQFRAAVYGDKPDPEEAQRLRNAGVQGAGPFYWLGAEMTRAIVAACGAGGISESLSGGGSIFFGLYLRSATGRNAILPSFSDGLRGALQEAGAERDSTTCATKT